VTPRHLLVIGAQRSGTTYLHSLLDAHPEIAMARPARPEPKVFLTDEVVDRGLNWYHEAYFAHAASGQLLGEKSTSYIEDPAAATRAARVLGTAEIVVMLRDPVDRAVSNWRFSTDNGFETRPLEAALRENLEGDRQWDGTATSVSPFAYLERGRYAGYLEPWTAAFPSTTHVIFLPELVEVPESLSRLYRSLGVDPGFRPANRDAQVNKSHEQAPELPTELVSRLRAYYRDSDAELSRVLGRELPWARHTEEQARD
jgi:hypothetical protein